MRAWIRPWIAVVLSALWAGPVARGQSVALRPVSPVGLLTEGDTITIDASLDEPAWGGAPLIDAFTQVEPVEGAPASERTEVRVLFDADNLYIGVRCFADPQSIIARQMRRDADLDDDDHVTISIDTFRDRRNGFIFIVSPAGGKRDGLVTDGRTEFNWDGIWYVRSRIDDRGWVSEIRIPTKTLSFDPAAPAWGFNVQRIMREHNEVVRWASANRDASITQMADAGDLDGFSGLRQGLGLDLKPFATLSSDFDNGNTIFEPGLDIFFKITPSITASMTFNTDFAETEVDDRQVNLTRFPLFFPEKRDFFLQDAGTFRFGGIRRSPLPFFSRRIGIVGGQEKEILAGLKVTGREGRVQFGLLDVQMKHDSELGDKNLLVGRVRVDVLEESSIGLIFTNGNPGARGQSSLAGIDFGYRSTSAIPGATLDGDLWIQGTTDAPADEDRVEDLAVGGRFRYENDPWEISVFAAHLGNDFRPRLGFARRPGEREYNANAEYRYRPNGGVDFLRSIEFSSRLGVFTGFDNEINTVEWTIPTVEFNSSAGDSAQFNLELTREKLDSPFTIIDGVTVPVGEYDNAGVSGEFSTSASRVVSADASYAYEGFFDGTRSDWGGGITFRPSPSLSLSGDYSQSDISLGDASFSVRILSGRVDVQFSPDISWSTIVQWDNQSDEAGLNTRLRWEFKPGNEMFIVYNAGFDTEDAYRTTTSEATIKLGWTLRY